MCVCVDRERKEERNEEREKERERLAIDDCVDEDFDIFRVAHLRVHQLPT